MYMLARVFQSLAERKPDLDAGVFAYAKAGFGDYPGFLSAFGYWIGTCIGNVSYWVLIKSTLGAFFPVFGDGNTVTAISRFDRHLDISFPDIARHQAGHLYQHDSDSGQNCAHPDIHCDFNLSFKADLFHANFWGGEGVPDTCSSRCGATMLVTVFVFLGVEGASVYSRYAKKRSDVGRPPLWALSACQV